VHQVGLLLGAAETLTALGLGLLFVTGVIVKVAGGALGLVLGDALSLALLVGGGLSVGLGLDLGGLASLLALYFRVLGGIPRVEDLEDRCQ
jgi:hypothetical protein